MRLSEFERNAIKKLAKEYDGHQARIILFGSRIDDLKKGVDIDIFIETPLKTGLKDKLNFLVQLEKKDR
jgi:predicted nucleotidyltransferase